PRHGRKAFRASTRANISPSPRCRASRAPKAFFQDDRFATGWKTSPPYRARPDMLRTAMRTSVVLTVIGDDKPGIVEQLAERVLATGANWGESRMARLAGKFAGLLRVSVEADQADALAAALHALEAGGLRVIVERSSAAAAP